MAFSRPTIETIYKRIKADIESRLALKTGKSFKIGRFSTYGILSVVFAGAIHLCYGVLVWLAKQFFVDTAEYEYLLKIGTPRGIIPKSATFATGDIDVIGLEGSVIASGTEWQNYEGTIYTSEIDTTIGAEGLVTITVTSSIASKDANLEVDDVELVIPLADVDSVADVVVPFIGGTDAETESEYKQRVKAFMASRPSGGRDEDYEEAVLNVSGVGKAWTYDAILGASSVGVAVASAEGEPVDAGILANAQTATDNTRPLGVIATVSNIIPKGVIITIQLLPNTVDVQTNVQNSLATFFLDNVRPSGTLLISAIREAVSRGGAIDYNITQINYNGVDIGVTDIKTYDYDYATLNTSIWQDF